MKTFQKRLKTFQKYFLPMKNFQNRICPLGKKMKRMTTNLFRFENKGYVYEKSRTGNKILLGLFEKEQFAGKVFSRL